jgi:tripartite-type tricarboxylate transporter receptor subunit TctC
VVQAGKVRWLAVTSEARFPSLPELPTLAERVPGIVMNGFFQSSRRPARRPPSWRAPQ